MVLMERAALAVFHEAMTSKYVRDNVLIICGTGNNGGDGFAVARLLHNANVKVIIQLVGSAKRMTNECRQQASICEYFNIPCVQEIDDYTEYSLIIDALFGIGLNGDVRKQEAQVIEKINNSNKNIIAIDIPSGLSSDTGKALGCAIRATSTVTFQFKKIGMDNPEAHLFCGNLLVADVGISGDTLQKNK